MICGQGFIPAGRRLPLRLLQLAPLTFLRAFDRLVELLPQLVTFWTTTAW
jgi:hypothetical protein